MEWHVYHSGPASARTPATSGAPGVRNESSPAEIGGALLCPGGRDTSKCTGLNNRNKLHHPSLPDKPPRVRSEGSKGHRDDRAGEAQ